MYFDKTVYPIVFLVWLMPLLYKSNDNRSIEWVFKKYDAVSAFFTPKSNYTSSLFLVTLHSYFSHFYECVCVWNPSFFSSNPTSLRGKKPCLNN